MAVVLLDIPQRRRLWKPRRIARSASEAEPRWRGLWSHALGIYPFEEGPGAAHDLVGTLGTAVGDGHVGGVGELGRYVRSEPASASMVASAYNFGAAPFTWLAVAWIPVIPTVSQDIDLIVGSFQIDLMIRRANDITRAWPQIDTGATFIARGSTITGGRWYTFAATRDGSLYTLYTDGLLDDTGTDATTWTSQNWRMANGLASDSSVQQPRLAFAAVLDAALSAEQVRAWHHDPFGLIRPQRRLWVAASAGGSPSLAGSQDATAGSEARALDATASLQAPVTISQDARVAARAWAFDATASLAGLAGNQDATAPALARAFDATGAPHAPISAGQDALALSAGRTLDATGLLHAPIQVGQDRASPVVARSFDATSTTLGAGGFQDQAATTSARAFDALATLATPGQAAQDTAGGATPRTLDAIASSAPLEIQQDAAAGAVVRAFDALAVKRHVYAQDQAAGALAQSFDAVAAPGLAKIGVQDQASRAAARSLDAAFELVVPLERVEIIELAVGAQAQIILSAGQGPTVTISAGQGAAITLTA